MTAALAAGGHAHGRLQPEASSVSLLLSAESRAGTTRDATEPITVRSQFRPSRTAAVKAKEPA